MYIYIYLFIYGRLNDQKLDFANLNMFFLTEYKYVYINKYI